MVQGLDTRALTQDPNAQSRALEPQSVPLSPVMKPQPSSFAGVGQAQRQLADVLGKADIGLGRYIDKKSEQWMLEGRMARAAGTTAEEISKTGNVYTETGWQAMNGEIASNMFVQDTNSFIQGAGKQMKPAEFQKYLSESFKGTMDKLPANDGETRGMIQHNAMQMFPQLVAEHTKQHNEYNKLQTFDKGRQMLVSIAKTKDAAELQNAVDTLHKVSGFDDRTFGSMIAAAIDDEYKLGSKNIATLLPTLGITAKDGAPVVNQPDANPPSMNGLLSLVGRAESSDNYSAVYGANMPQLTAMTLNDVIKLQGNMVSGGSKSSAVGRYQIINKTLMGLKDELKLTGDEVFDESLQDRMGIALLKRRGVDDFLSGKLSPEQFQLNLAQEWAGLPKDSSGLSFYDGFNGNKATVHPGAVANALGATTEATALYGTLSAMGVSSDDISKVIKSNESFEREQSTKFDATRVMSEQTIIKSAPDLSDKDLYAKIEETKKANGYSDEWANGVWRESLSSRKESIKERAKVAQVTTMIANNSVKNGTKEQQESAIDLVADQAMKANPAAADPNDPGYETARGRVMDNVFKFMDANQITDERMKNTWDIAVTGDIVGKDGKIKQSALEAYRSYQQAKRSVANPLFAKSLLSDKAQVLFQIADSYNASMTGLVPTDEETLIQASTFYQEQTKTKMQANVPVWAKDPSKAMSIREDLVSNTIPSLFSDTLGIGREQAQKTWQINSTSAEQAAMSPHVTNMILQRAQELWPNYQSWPDQGAAQKNALEQAASQVAQQAEFVMGTYVLAPQGQPKLQERLGMGGIKNSANMVVSRIMQEIGPQKYGERWLNPDLFQHSQTWYEQKPGLGKAWGWVGDAVTQFPGKFMSGQDNLVMQRLVGVPDANVVLNPSGNALTVTPYRNVWRTQQDLPTVIPLDKAAEAAAFLKVGDEAGFKKWAEDYKKTLPGYKGKTQ